MVGLEHSLTVPTGYTSDTTSTDYDVTTSVLNEDHTEVEFILEDVTNELSWS